MEKKLGERWVGPLSCPPPPSPPLRSPRWRAFDFPSQKHPPPPRIGIQGSFMWGLLHFQSLMSTLPSQDAPLPPPQQPYIAGQQPVYQQVSPAQGCQPARLTDGGGAVLGGGDSAGQDCFPADSEGRTRPHAATHAGAHTAHVLNPVDAGRELLTGNPPQAGRREAWSGLGLAGTEHWG